MFEPAAAGGRNKPIRARGRQEKLVTRLITAVRKGAMRLAQLVNKRETGQLGPT